MQILYTGGIWGFYTHIEMWLNHNDLSKSDAILYFTNLSPAIPAGKSIHPTFSIKSNSIVWVFTLTTLWWSWIL